MQLGNHMKTHQIKTCDICQKVMNGNNYLRHLKEHKNKEAGLFVQDKQKAPIICPHCRMIFGWKKSMMRHEMYCKDNPKNMKQIEWEEDIPNVYVKLNPSTILRLGIIECDQCGFEASRERGLKIHMTKKHMNNEKENIESVNKCNECKFIASGPRGLKIHMTKKHMTNAK